MWRGWYYLVVGKGKGTMMATRFETINDVVEEYVRPTLGKWAKYYDLLSIAYEITYYPTVRDGKYVCLDRSQRVLKDVYDPVVSSLTRTCFGMSSCDLITRKVI